MMRVVTLIKPPPQKEGSLFKTLEQARVWTTLLIITNCYSILKYRRHKILVPASANHIITIRVKIQIQIQILYKSFQLIYD